MRRGADDGGAGGVRVAAAGDVAPVAGDVARPGPGAVVPMGTPPPPRRAARRAEDDDDRGGGWSKLERLANEVADWRMTLEVRLIGAILACPRIGLGRAEQAGVTADVFERPDARLMFCAAQCCREALGDRIAVLATARHALRWGGYWLDAALACERGMLWSDASLVDLAGSEDVADVGLYAAQLIDLDARVREARGCWERMVELLDGVGRRQ